MVTLTMKGKPNTNNLTVKTINNINSDATHTFFQTPEGSICKKTSQRVEDSDDSTI